MIHAMKRALRILILSLSFGCLVWPCYAQKSRKTSKQTVLMELPAINSSDKILRYCGFTVSYNTSALIPRWVAYELTAEEVDGTFPRAKSFSMDPSYRGRQAMREDYSNSGWDKGHMAPAANMKWSQQAMYESFYLTNVCPQNHELNGQDWQTLEKLGRNWAKQYGHVYIVCGPIIGKNKYGTIGDQRVVVPDAFFKAFLMKKGDLYCTIAFIMDNNAQHHRIQDYALTVNQLEEKIGIDLFPGLDDMIEEIVEDDLYFKHWRL